MRIKKVDSVVKEYLGLTDREVDELKYYFIDGPITSVEIIGCGSPSGQGVGWLVATFYIGDEEFVEVMQKEHATSLKLRVGLGDLDLRFSYCVDPRVVATHILAARLTHLGYKGGVAGEVLEKEISEALTPVFTIEEAEDWLERNFFIGPNSLQRQAIAADDFRKPNKLRKYPECWNARRTYGWNIYYIERELAYVPPKARPLYDRYYALWKKPRKAASSKRK
ncbi:MAG: hypothetical protein PHO46_03030 [Thermoguttaceae bacterium]|jgi:hypothetical protein|nr:hypothetical protein [Thermoguttaceae bacterium]